MGPAKPEEWPSDTQKTKLAQLHPYAIVRRSIPSAVKGRMPCTYTFDFAHLGGLENPHA